MTVHVEPTPPSVEPGVAPPTPTPRSPGRPLQTRLTPYLLLLPATAAVLAITAWPLLTLLLNSLQEYGRDQVFGAPADFVGFDNTCKCSPTPTSGRCWSARSPSPAPASSRRCCSEEHVMAASRTQTAAYFEAVLQSTVGRQGYAGDLRMMMTGPSGTRRDDVIDAMQR